MTQYTLLRNLVFFSLVLLLPITNARAENIRVPIGQQASNLPTIDMPGKGLSKEQVKNLFGEPLEEMPAKGQPPISRWRHQEFTVYFDNNSVIHCVRNFKPDNKTITNSSELPTP